MTRLALLTCLLSGLCLSDEVSLTKEQREFLNSQRPSKQFEQSLTMTTEALDGYRALTELILKNSNLEKDYKLHHIAPDNIPTDAKIQVTITGKQLLDCKRIDWESQHLGFYNHVKHLHSCYEFQEYRILKLELEIAQLKNKPERKIDQLKKRIQKMEQHLIAEYLGEDKWHD